MKEFSYIAIIICFLTACLSRREGYNIRPKASDEYTELEYYRVFTEATKQALFGNYKGAIGLYYECLKISPKRAAPYYQLSSIYLRIENIEKAKEFASIAIQFDNSNIWYKLHLANIYQFENKIDSAIILYEKIIETDRKTDYLYNLVLLYNSGGRNPDALKLLDELSEGFENNKEIFLLKHKIFEEEKQIDSAVFQLELLKKYYPEDASNYGILAEYLSEIGKINYAKETYENALLIDSTNGLILLSFGDYWYYLENIDSAIICYKKALCCSDLDSEKKNGFILNLLQQELIINENEYKFLELMNEIDSNKLDYMIYGALSNYYVKKEDYEKAIEYMDICIRRDSTNYLFWEQYLILNNYYGRHDSVINIANKCKLYFNNKPNIFLIKAYSENALEKKDSAIFDLKKVVELNPEKDLLIQAYSLLGQIYKDVGNNLLSDENFEKVLELDYNNLVIRNNYGYYLSIREERLEYAKELSYYTILKEPDNATYLDTYGWILFKLGDTKKAKDYIESAIKNGANNNAEVIDHYGEIMMKLNRCKDAIEAWEKVIEIDSTYKIGNKLIEIKKVCK